mgnify:CR=1 FL=1
MAKIDKLVEDYFSPPRKISFDVLYEMVTNVLEQNVNEALQEEEEEGAGEMLDLGTEADDEVAVCDSAIGCDDFGSLDPESEPLQEQMSGQDSERNLVAAVKNVVYANGGQPVSMTIGTLGEQMVVDAEQMGGGKPEPKADISLVLADGGTIGLSMKKQNFGFFENRMDENKLRALMVAAKMEPAAIDILVQDMKDKLAEVTQDQATVIEEEKRRFLDIVTAADPSYTFPSPLIKDGAAHQALALSEGFGRNGVLRNPFKIKNVYLHLSDVLGESYRDFLMLVCAGSADNPAKAGAVLIADVPPGITDTGELQNILSRTQSIDEAVDYYVTDPNINVKLRLRPITKVRTTYSRSNRSHYKVGERMYDDPDLGVSWTVFAAT